MRAPQPVVAPSRVACRLPLFTRAIASGVRVVPAVVVVPSVMAGTVRARYDENRPRFTRPDDRPQAAGPATADTGAGRTAGPGALLAAALLIDRQLGAQDLRELGA
ncbi:hypothetical protein Asi03nite_71680 [Actinoplanes siamensis]|uniref:Uncharacterized protein n=1 Tax=Actinoplanes siamensis TaxID=1223317 RepID=A0A919NFL5_9ACTN|nr:hypothetical protein Asi03nite_71680 [Actinoplanes siamensis]